MAFTFRTLVLTTLVVFSTLVSSLPMASTINSVGSFVPDGNHAIKHGSGLAVDGSHDKRADDAPEHHCEGGFHYHEGRCIIDPGFGPRAIPDSSRDNTDHGVIIHPPVSRPVGYLPICEFDESSSPKAWPCVRGYTGTATTVPSSDLPLCSELFFSTAECVYDPLLASKTALTTVKREAETMRLCLFGKVLARDHCIGTEKKREEAIEEKRQDAGSPHCPPPGKRDENHVCIQ